MGIQRPRCDHYGYHFVFVALLFPVILVEIAGFAAGDGTEAGSSSEISRLPGPRSIGNGSYKNINYKSISDPPNFEFVTKKQEKLKLINGINLTSTSIPPSNFNSRPKTPKAESDSDTEPVQVSVNSTTFNVKDVNSSSVQNLKSEDQKQQQAPISVLLQNSQIETVLNTKDDGKNQNEIQRVTRRISGTQTGIGAGYYNPQMLQNQYDTVAAGSVGVGDRKFKGWNVIDDDEKDAVWSGPGSLRQNSNQNQQNLPAGGNRIKNVGQVLFDQSRSQSQSQNIGPDGKTIGHLPSLPTLDIVEDPGYDHGPRPKWPLNEYLTDKFNSFYRPIYYGQTRNKTDFNGPTKHVHQQLYHQGYEWQKLQQSQSQHEHQYQHQEQQQNQHHHHTQAQPHNFGSTASESHHNYDSTKLYHLDDENFFQNQDQTTYGNNDNYKNNLYGNHANALGHGYRSGYTGYPSHHRLHQSGTNEHETTVSTSTDVGKGSAAGAASSSSRDIVKHGSTNGPYGHAHYFPPDYYPKKRFRLQIHPGYIAAPIAGLAAFGAASALTKKPLLFELGLVNNKHHYKRPIPYPGGYPTYGPGHGWASNVVPNYYPVNPPLVPHTNPANHASGGPTYPIIQPQASYHHKPHVHTHGHHHLHNHNHNYGWGQHENQNQNQHHHHNSHSHNHNHNHHGHGHGHHHHHTNDGDKKPWWNPFAALTPRD